MTQQRTKQDNDLSLYSLDELKVIDSRYKGNPTGWMPFNQKEVKAEIRRREGKPDFLQDWTQPQFKAIEKAISRHFSFKPMVTEQGNYPAMFLTFTAVADRIGLAYTSSSSYAGYWVCNAAPINPKYPNYRYIGFAISTDEKYYAILWDKDESEIIMPI